MSFEKALQDLNTERMERVVDSMVEQVRAGRNAGSFLSDDLEEKYAKLDEFGDILKDRLQESARRGEVPPPIAQEMIIGARLMIASLVEYAEVESLEDIVGYDQ